MRPVNEPRECFAGRWRGAPDAEPDLSRPPPMRGPVIASTTPPNIPTNPKTLRIGKFPIMVALKATPDTSIATPITKSAAPWSRRPAEGARRLPPRTLEANLAWIHRRARPGGVGSGDLDCRAVGMLYLLVCPAFPVGVSVRPFGGWVRLARIVAGCIRLCCATT